MPQQDTGATVPTDRADSRQTLLTSASGTETPLAPATHTAGLRNSHTALTPNSHTPVLPVAGPSSLQHTHRTGNEIMQTAG